MSLRIKNITLGIPQVVCSHMSIRPEVEELDATSCIAHVQVFDKENIVMVEAVLDTDGVTVLVPAVTYPKKTVLWTGVVPITEEQYALCWNNKTLMEDYVITYLGLERR